MAFIHPVMAAELVKAINTHHLPLGRRHERSRN